MATAPKRKFRSYMKPPAKKLTISKPEWKTAAEPGELLPGGFTRVGEGRVRKIY